MLDIQMTLAAIKEQIEKKVSHPELIKYIHSPFIDEDKLLLLVSIMDQQKLAKKDIENYALTTMLIQIALDTHELVKNKSIPAEEQEDNRTCQLTVLAGDYYSGLYYKLLAEASDIAMIRTLAEGIKEINEHKITLYQKESDGIEKLMETIKMIEASLFEKLSGYFHAPLWKEFSGNLLLVKRLFEEKAHFLQAGTSIVFDAMRKLAFPKSEQSMKELSKEQQKYLLLICDRYIDFSRHLIEKNLKKLPGLNSHLEERVRLIINQQTTVANTFVEEG